MTAAWGEPRPAEHHQCNTAAGSQAGTAPIPPPSHRARRTCCLWSRRRLCRWQPEGCEGCEHRRTRAAAPGRNPGASCAAARRPRPAGPRPPARSAFPTAGTAGRPPAAPGPAAPRPATSHRPPRPRRPPDRPQSWAAPAHRPPSLPGQRAPARDTPGHGHAPAHRPSRFPLAAGPSRPRPRPARAPPANRDAGTPRAEPNGARAPLAREAPRPLASVRAQRLSPHLPPSVPSRAPRWRWRDQRGRRAGGGAGGRSRHHLTVEGENGRERRQGLRAPC